MKPDDYIMLNTRCAYNNKDLDSQRLTFLNNNCCTYQYLYFWYIITLINADIKKYQNFYEKTPPGCMWASLGKADRYVRSSVLRSLARKIGDKDPPEELIEADTFGDESMKQYETAAKINIAMHIRKTLSEEEEDDEEGEDE